MRTSMFVTLSVLFVFLSGNSFSQNATSELPPEAKTRLDHRIGAWDIKMEFLDRNGEVRRTTSGKDTARYLIGDWVVELTTVMAGQGSTSKAWIFYNGQEGKFYLTSVDSGGDLWVLSGGLDEYVITSTPKPTRNGREMTIRFTHSNIQKDSFEAVMETSIDGGQSWWTRSRQYITRSK